MVKTCRTSKVLWQRFRHLWCLSFATLALWACLSVPLEVVESKTTSAALTNTAVVAQTYAVGVIGRSDASGTGYGPFANLAFRQKLFNDFTGDLLVRLSKPANADSDGVTVALERGQLAFSKSWVNLAVGRRELGFLLSPASYFGPFVTMGETTHDAASASLRLRLSGDVPDSEAAFANQEVALSIHYIPNPFSAGKSLADGSQGLFISQLFLGLDTWGVLSRLYLNLGQFQDAYFRYSAFSGNPSLEVGFSQTYARLSRFFITYGNQNTMTEGSAALVVGNETWNLAKTFKVLEKVQIEYQIPLTPSYKNPFTGGNVLSPTAGTLAEPALFIRIHNRFGGLTPSDPARFFYGAAATNSRGDYALSSLKPGTTAAVVPPAYGRGPRVEYTPFTALDTKTYAFLFYAGYEY